MECIADLLKYDPAARLTSAACVRHRYLSECRPYVPAVPTSMATSQPASRPSRSHGHSQRAPVAASTSNSGMPLESHTPRQLPPSHSYPSGHGAEPPVQVSLSPPHQQPYAVSQTQSFQTLAPLTHASLNHHSMRSPARSDLDSVASPSSTSAPLTASSSPMSPALYPTTGSIGLPPMQLLQSRGDGNSNNAALLPLVDQMRELDLPMDTLGSYSHAPNDHHEPRPSPTKQMQQQQSQQWMQHDRSRGKRRGSDPDVEMVEGNVSCFRSSYCSVNSFDSFSFIFSASRPRDDLSASQSGSKGLFGKVKKNKSWGIFGGGGAEKNGTGLPLPPVEESGGDGSGSTPSLSHSHSDGGDSSRKLLADHHGYLATNGHGDYPNHSGMPYASTSSSALASSSAPALGDHQYLSQSQPPPPVPPIPADLDPKLARKELAKRRRAEQEEALKARSRAVNAKRERIERGPGDSVLENWQPLPLNVQAGPDKGKQRARPPPSSYPIPPNGARRVNGAEPRRGLEASDSGSSVRPMLPPIIQEEGGDYQQMIASMASGQRSSKARRRDLDDDHSMSSADTRPNLRRQSIATVDSDPGPTRPMPPQRLRERPSAMNMSRAASHSSLRSGLSTGNSSLRGYSSSARSSTSLEQGFLEGFASTNMGTHTTLSSSELQHPHLHPYSHHPHHSHRHHHRAPQSSSSSLGGHPNSLPPMLTNSQHSSTITLPPISSIGNPPPSMPGLNDKGSHETLHPKLAFYADVDMSPEGQSHPMFHVVRFIIIYSRACTSAYQTNHWFVILRRRYLEKTFR